MTHFEYLHPPSPSGLIKLAEAAEVAGHLRRGSLAILPTETGYLLAALATSVSAAERAFEVKRRAAAQVMHVACSSLTMAGAAGQLTTRARRILGEFTPGPVSVIVPQTGLLPDHLVTLNGTVGLRIPDHPATLQVISELGQPVTATSLNESGCAPGPLGPFDLGSLNWRAGETVYVVVDDESIRYDAASTLIRVTGADVEVLRAGPVTETDIHRVVGG